MSEARKPARLPGRAALAAALALFSLLGAAPLAQATYDPLAQGTTTLRFDPAFLSFLGQHGVALEARSPARLSGGTLTLPVSGGEMDPTIGKGTIEQEGVLVFKRGKLSVPFRRLTLKAKRTPLQAKVGGSQLKVARAKEIATRRSGFGTTFTATGLELSAKVATRLGKKLHLGHAFTEGQLLGSLTSKTEPATVTVLPQGRATIVFDPAIVAKLNALFVAINPIFPAEHSGSTFTFPIIVGGQIAPDAGAGTLRSGGDIEFLQLGGGQIFWHELWFDLGARVDSAEANVQPSPPYPGKQGRVSLLDLGAATVTSDPRARTIAVSGAPLTLQAQAAASFNEAFAEGKEVFGAGERFGTLSFTAQGQ